jgi:uncharacterized membrane protein
MEVRASTKIDKPKQEVFEYISDPNNDPTWISGIVSAQVMTGWPVNRGTQVKRLATFLGRSIEYVLEIVDFQPNKLVAMRSIQAPFPMEVDYAVREVGSGTEFEIRVGGDAGGFYRLATPLMEFQVRRSLNRDVATVKKILEGV